MQASKKTRVITKTLKTYKTATYNIFLLTKKPGNKVNKPKRTQLTIMTSTARKPTRPSPNRM